MSLDTSQALLEKITGALAPVGGVRAIVLGGSRGRGLHHAGSDYDIGLYYWDADGIDFAALDRAAAELNDGARETETPIMSRFGGWGEWVNGGGWLQIGGQPVDIMYRDLARVDRVIAESARGEFVCAYHYGHPHAFVSTIYAGEIATCTVLHDPQGLVAARKGLTAAYPDALRGTAVNRFGHEGRFFLRIAQKAAGRGDVTYVSGCAYRAAACLLQVVFAINGQWLLNEKGALALAATFERAPKDLRPSLEAAFTELAAGPQGMLSALRAIEDLLDASSALV